jgi:hypothetical protein
VLFGMLKDELVRPGVIRYAMDYLVRFGVVYGMLKDDMVR